MFEDILIESTKRIDLKAAIKPNTKPIFAQSWMQVNIVSLSVNWSYWTEAYKCFKSMLSSAKHHKFYEVDLLLVKSWKWTTL